MSWVTERYKNPTQAQLLAGKARKMLHELNIPCECEHGEPTSYFAWPMEGTGIPKGTMLPSSSTIIKMCKRCELNNILYNIEDPDDMASVFT